MEYVAIPKEWMDEIEKKLDRIERNTLRALRNDVPVIGEVYSVDTVAKKLGVAKLTVYRWVREGRLRGVRTGGRVLIPDTALEEFMRGGGNEHHERDEA